MRWGTEPVETNTLAPSFLVFYLGTRSRWQVVVKQKISKKMAGINGPTGSEIYLFSNERKLFEFSFRNKGNFLFVDFIYKPFSCLPVSFLSLHFAILWPIPFPFLFLSPSLFTGYRYTFSRRLLRMPSRHRIPFPFLLFLSLSFRRNFTFFCNPLT